MNFMNRPPIHLRLDMYSQGYAGDKRHAQTVMKDLGITYQTATPQSLGDQWWFWNCQNLPDELPEWITPLGIDPMDAVGHGLSEEMAAEIRDFA